MVALAGGAAAQALGLPLAWVLGAMFAVAALSLATATPRRQPAALRRAAQGCIGLALGLLFSQEVLSQVGGIGHWVVVGALTALGLSVLAAPLMQRMSGADGPTAIYAVALGASSEMSLQAQRAGANAAAVATAHAVRIILVTTCATALAWLLGHAEAATHAGTATQRSGATLGIQPMLVLLFAGVGAGWLLQRMRVPNPWLLGPLLVGGTYAIQSGPARLPAAVTVLAQVVIGWASGQHVTREFFRRAPRWLACSASVTLGILAVCMAVAAALAHASGMPLMAAFIAMAPGGMAEMGVIAKAFGLAAPAVIAFHLLRIVLTVFLTQRLAAWMLRSGWVKAHGTSASSHST
jgi:membrane AbrB-like protein